MNIRYRCSTDFARPASSHEVVPFGIYGAGLWTSHPIGLVIVNVALFMGFVGLPEADRFSRSLFLPEPSVDFSCGSAIERDWRRLAKSLGQLFCGQQLSIQGRLGPADRLVGRS